MKKVLALFGMGMVLSSTGYAQDCVYGVNCYQSIEKQYTYTRQTQPKYAQTNSQAMAGGVDNLYMHVQNPFFVPGAKKMFMRTTLEMGKRDLGMREILSGNEGDFSQEAFAFRQEFGFGISNDFTLNLRLDYVDVNQTLTDVPLFVDNPYISDETGLGEVAIGGTFNLKRDKEMSARIDVEYIKAQDDSISGFRDSFSLEGTVGQEERDFVIAVSAGVQYFMSGSAPEYGVDVPSSMDWNVKLQSMRMINSQFSINGEVGFHMLSDETSFNNGDETIINLELGMNYQVTSVTNVSLYGGYNIFSGDRVTYSGSAIAGGTATYDLENNEGYYAGLKLGFMF